ncbi:MAG: hypothetical protein ABIM21_00445 [candidate division WOR-3 bacterium]
MKKQVIAYETTDLSKAFIAAIIAAAQDNQCQCKTCQIMRKAALEYLKILEG